MIVTYQKLWKILEERGYSKMRVCREAGITTNAMAQLGKNEEVRLLSLVKICNLLDCTLDDIVEIVRN